MSSDKYLHIIENFNDVIWTIDINTSRFTYVSPSVTNLLGYTVKEALTGVFDDNPYNNNTYWTTQKNILLEIKKLVHSNREYSDIQFEYQMPNKKGTQIWVETEVRILKEDGIPKEILGITRNIEDRKRVATLLQNNTKELKKLNEQKDLFIKILAHDLRSPFSVLLGYSDNLLESINSVSNDDLKYELSVINHKLYSTFHLLEELLMWTKQQAGTLHLTLESVFFTDLCNNVLKNMTLNPKNIKINYFESEIIRLKTDVNMLKVILRNLISNAVKFSDKNGIINIFAIKSPEDITITVSDSGVGMTEEQLSKLWQNSESTTGTHGEKGFGLGLTFCKQLVENLGGKIWAESQIDKGSNFIFSLPN